MELKLGHDIKVKVGENKKYKTTLHLPLRRRGRGEVARGSCCGGRCWWRPPLPLVLASFVLEAGTAKSGYIAILIGDIFG